MSDSYSLVGFFKCVAETGKDDRGPRCLDPEAGCFGETGAGGVGSGRVGSEFFSHWEVDEIVTFDPGAATDHVRCQFAGAHPSFDGLVRRPNSSGDVIEIERVIDGRGREPQIIVEINLCLTMIYH